jgi:hypothetical protein
MLRLLVASIRCAVLCCALPMFMIINAATSRELTLLALLLVTMPLHLYPHILCIDLIEDDLQLFLTDYATTYLYMSATRGALVSE